MRSRVRALAGLIIKVFVFMGAFASFCLAILIESGPRVGIAPVPTAYDVRAGLEFAGQVENMLAASEPLSMVIDMDTLSAVHALTGYAKSDLRVGTTLVKGRADFRLSRQIARWGWLNVGVSLAQGPDAGVPRMRVAVGPRLVPQSVTDALVRLVIWLVPKEAGKPASFADMIPRFKVDNHAIRADVQLPKHVVGGMRAALNPFPDVRVDSTRTRAIYGRLLYRLATSSERDYASLIALAAHDSKGADGLRETITALTLLTDGMRIRRFMGERTTTAVCPLRGEEVLLHARSDLPKHWTLSASLALFMDPRAARAVGLWKEMSDSLPGGSGFSFIDLGADMGGALLGAFAREIDDETADALLALLRSGRTDVVLPAAVMQLPEGISHDDFIRHYKGLDQPELLAAENALWRILAGSPLYRSRF